MKTLVRKITFLCLCLCVTMSYVAAQNTYITISGQLIDGQSKERLPFASIYIKGTSIGTASNAEGGFIFHIPTNYKAQLVVISMIGYKSIERLPSTFMKGGTIKLEEDSKALDEVVINTDKALTAKQVVKKAYQSLSKNLPTTPYVLEAFVRDLQQEDESYVELLECAVKMRYQKYNTKAMPQIELQEVKRSYIAKKHPWGEQWERKNSLIDLVEDDFIRFDYGPIRVNKGWKYEIEAILPFNNRLVYKVKAINPPFQTALFYIDTDSFAFIRIELMREKQKNRNYRRRLATGQQEIAYHVVFEYQEYQGKMYLKYQKEEDVWAIYKGETNKLLFTQYPKKELFVNQIIVEKLAEYPFQANLDHHTSIENQAKPYNSTFWKYYNAPAQTKELSKIEEYLKNDKE